MKNFYCLIIFMGVLFACSREVNTTEHLYLCNALDETVTLNLFKNNEIFTYEIKPNDTIYFTTINSGYVVRPGEVNVHFPPATDRALYLNSFDSATVAYNLLFYIFTKNERLYSDSTNTLILPFGYAYPFHFYSSGDYSYYTYNEEYFEFLNREIGYLSYITND